MEYPPAGGKRRSALPIPGAVFRGLFPFGRGWQRLQELLTDGGTVSLDPPAYLQFPSQDFDGLIDGLDGGGEVRVLWIIPPCGVKPFPLGGKSIYLVLHRLRQHGKLLPGVNAVFHQQPALLHIAVKFDDLVRHVTSAPW